MYEINQLLDDLIKFNTQIQINNSMHICKNNPSTDFCRQVKNPDNHSEWFDFYTNKNNKNLFSKGRERLNTWIHLLSDNPTLYFTKEVIPSNPYEEGLMNEMLGKINHNKNNNPYVYFFIMSALIIIFQVFGDGNHRTAQHLMEYMKYKKISKVQAEIIDDILEKNDYINISDNPIEKMHEIIYRLVDIATQMSGGIKKKKINRKSIKSKNKYRKRRKSRKV